MYELVEFMNCVDVLKYDLMKVVFVYYCFGWIYLFGNGNGRMVYLLIYFLLIKYGFNVKISGWVLNLIVVFCYDCECYYLMLVEVDMGVVEGLEYWCLYVFIGILVELKKVDKFFNFYFLNLKIFYLVFEYFKGWGVINEMEFIIFK